MQFSRFENWCSLRKNIAVIIFYFVLFSQNKKASKYFYLEAMPYLLVCETALIMAAKLYKLGGSVLKVTIVPPFVPP